MLDPIEYRDREALEEQREVDAEQWARFGEPVIAGGLRDHLGLISPAAMFDSSARNSDEER